MTILIQHWKSILIAVALFGSNYITKEYVSRGYEQKLSEMNVEGLKSTLAQQQNELVKQKQIVDNLVEVNQNAQERNIQINNELADANDALGMLKQTISRLSKAGKSAYTGTVDRSAAANATTELIYGQLLERCATRVIGLAEIADRSRAAGLSCESQYNKIKDIINGS